MNRQFRLFVLQSDSEASHKYLGHFVLTLDPSSTMVESLEEAVRTHIKSRPEFRSWGEDLDNIIFEVYQPSQEMKKKEWMEKIRLNQLDQFKTVESNTTLNTLEGPQDFVFVFESSFFRFVLFETTGSSRKFLALGTTTAPRGQDVGTIEQAARDCVQARFGCTLEVDLRVWEPQGPFELDDPPSPRSARALGELINQQYMDNCHPLESTYALERITHRNYLIITFTLRFGFALFESGPGPSPYACIGSGELVASFDDTVQVVADAATRSIVEFLSTGSEEEILVDSVKIYQYEEAYGKTLKQMESLVLGGAELARGNCRSTLVERRTPLQRISSSNFIVECFLRRLHRLQINYVVFKRDSETFTVAGYAVSELLSDKKVQNFCDDARKYIKSLPGVGKETEHLIEVYQPTEIFEEAYGKTLGDLKALKLEKQHLQATPAKLFPLEPQTTLSVLNVNETLIVIFSTQSRSVETLSDNFGELQITHEAPSAVSLPMRYKALQNQPGQRNLDNRPCADLFLPPISLLYDGFGIFEDVRQMVPVPGEEDILDGQLWDKVDAFITRMAAFYDSEAERRHVVADHLLQIFRARKNPDVIGESLDASKIGSRQIISDGHINGAHNAMVFCIECKNELTGITNEPSFELVSYVASSFREQLKWEDGRALFNGWRASALGMTQIGAFVQFFGIVVISPHMRAVPLTPMLPLTIAIDDHHSRRNLFLTFKAASIVIAKLRTDVKRLVHGPTPPEIPFKSRKLPSITKIKAFPISTPPSPPTYISFELLSRYDEEVTYRNLYHARVDSTGQQIYVKFTQQYSPYLHVFCADKGLAPKLLGFEKLIGGWYALAMEKVDTVELHKIVYSSEELDTWKKEIGALVEGFHLQGLVHGDLRLANFIFTRATPRKMFLVDFDWGGKVGSAVFPPGELARELHVQEGCLDRSITVQHDDEVLARTFARLSHPAVVDVDMNV